MKIAVVGSSGYIASYLCRQFSNQGHVLVKIDKRERGVRYLDLEKADKFSYPVLNDIDFVIFTAAISGPDQCAVDYDLCWKINVEGTGYFIRKALNRKCRVLFFSSDAVFGDNPGCIYTEKSECRPVTAYGSMKKAVEDEFRGNQYFKAVRLSYVTSASDRFITYCLNCIRDNKMAEVFHPFYRNCITISDIIDVTSWLVCHFDEYEPFVLNVAGEELVSRVRIADELNRIFNSRLHYTVLQPDKIFFKNRPMITQMKSLYLGECGILKPQSFTDKIQKELKGIRL